MFTYLSAQDLRDLHTEYMGTRLPDKPGCLDRVANTPRQGFAGVEAYPDLITKAAAYMWFVSNGHCYIDGNKRLGWIAGEQFLYANGYEVDRNRLSNEDMAAKMLDVNQSLIDVEQLANWLRPLVVVLSMAELG